MCIQDVRIAISELNRELVWESGRVPFDIPCFETSDGRLWGRHPVVSVNIVAYNHAPYIRQTIEGVLVQKTDFAFELVIGENASADRTRAICFEYQKFDNFGLGTRFARISPHCVRPSQAPRLRPILSIFDDRWGSQNENRYLQRHFRQ